MNIKQIIEDVEKSSIPLSDYFADFPKGEFSKTEEIIDEIRLAKQEKCDWKLEYLLIMADLDGLDRRYTKIFCELLEADWHYSLEDIVSLLDKIRDPDSLAIIYRRAINIPNQDEGRSLAKKCIWALKSINNLEAVNFLHLLAADSDSIVSRAARLELES